GIIAPTYAEHEHHWRLAGHDVRCLSLDEVDSELDELEVLVLVRPNNPDGACPPRSRVLDWWRQLCAREGWLVVDEAFVDAVPEESLVEYTQESGFIVLRSFGKFFGHPGLRLGFVLTHEVLLKMLHDFFGAWSVSTIARVWGTKALCDTAWQWQARKRLLVETGRLESLLRSVGLAPDGGTAFFQYLRHREADDIHQALAAMGIMVRRFQQAGEGCALRLGLPGKESCWQRLEKALQVVTG
ncbi:MAG TPA: aminotransferase class I/II-fold pyridoxal phosphate-dependent enzyme, partial [Gammaproteobacteria bacterium]|nr:aminotransferase class I/II-fold pyridoxal phosphate-dependent enzyme [Gammaproteobacteria bacterium]